MENAQYSDAEIIGKILDGNPALYEILIRRYNPYLYKIGRSYNYDHQDTQDLMQDTFIAAYFALPKFENRSGFKTWISKIMLNQCHHKRRKASFKNEVRAAIDDDASPLFTDPTDTVTSVMNKELQRIIEQALNTIPEMYRMVFALREVSGMNVAETAEILDISESNVKVRLNRAKSMLRNEIEKSYSVEEIFEFNLIYCDAIVENVMSRIASVESKIADSLG